MLLARFLVARCPQKIKSLFRGPNSNVVGYDDEIMGTWAFTYDTLNRLATATEGTGPAPPAGIPNAAQGLFSDYCWSYDQWGNRTQQLGANTAFPSTAGGPQICTTSQPQFTYNTDNHILTSPTGAPVYDAAGDITTGTAGNVYLYDAEGRICAVATAGMDGMGPSMTGYVYDAAGNRVAKGPITTMSCNPTTNGFETSGEESDYISNQQGQVVTKTTMDEGVMTWNYTNVYADGQLFATYDAQGLHFDLDDWLGTRRVTTDYAGVVEQTCASLPYGDQLNCTGSVDAPNEQHFTGKTHDTESGLDYFGARYYSENDARFMSPDWNAKVEPVPYAKLDNPQSLNLYEYMLDSPLDGVDPDGHWPNWNEVKTGLNIVGFVPVIGDAANAASGGISLAQGHYGEAALSFAAAVPVVGILGEIGKGAELVKEADTAVHATEEGASIAARAKEIQGTLNPVTQTKVTTAVGEAVNADGSVTRLVGSSEGVLRPAQRAALQPGEVAVRGRVGTHAEVNVLNGAKENGQTLTSIAPSRPACSACSATMQENNVKVINPQ